MPALQTAKRLLIFSGGVVGLFLADGALSIINPRRRPKFFAWADEVNCQCIVHGMDFKPSIFSLRGHTLPFKQKAVEYLHGEGVYGPKPRVYAEIPEDFNTLPSWCAPQKYADLNVAEVNAHRIRADWEEERLGFVRKTTMAREMESDGERQV